MTFYRKDFGKNGEEKVALFLEKNGWKILKKNYINKKRIGEIDIIAIKKYLIAFVEVKSRKNYYLEDIGEKYSACNYYRYR